MSVESGDVGVQHGKQHYPKQCGVLVGPSRGRGRLPQLETAGGVPELAAPPLCFTQDWASLAAALGVGAPH